MGIGFISNDEQPKDVVEAPKALYGLTPTQMMAMGLTNDASVRRAEPKEVCEQHGILYVLLTLVQETLRAAYWYPGEQVNTGSRMVVKMSAGTGAAPGQAPPDLPSLLLDARICYIGMPLVPQVTELVISELLWLNYSNQQKPVFVYINSIGSQTADGQAVALDQEAYAILDTLGYIKPDVHTLVCGQVCVLPLQRWCDRLCITITTGVWQRRDDPGMRQAGLPVRAAQQPHHDRAAAHEPQLWQHDQHDDQG